MGLKNKPKITVDAVINTSLEKVWNFWTQPEHIIKWNNASLDWHTPKAENDLKAGGKFLFRMEAKDGSFGFDFEGVYDRVIHHELISYVIADGRKVDVVFSPLGSKTAVSETFEAENTNSLELQEEGWQSILNNFKKYAEES